MSSAGHILNYIKFKANIYCLPQFFSIESIKSYYDILAGSIFENAMVEFDIKFEQSLTRGEFDSKYVDFFDKLEKSLSKAFIVDIDEANEYLSRGMIISKLSPSDVSQIQDLISYVQQKSKSTERLCKSAITERACKIRTPTSTPNNSPACEGVFIGSSDLASYEQGCSFAKHFRS